MNPLRNFDLNLLVIFDALMAERHVSRAAERVFLSQSAMSHALNRLRQQFDDPLLVRSGNGLQPTARALAILPEVRQALQLVNQTLMPPGEFDPACSSRRFTVACTDFFEAVIFPDLVARMQKSAPNMQLEVDIISPETFGQELESGKVDLVVGIDCSYPLPGHLLSEAWLSQPYSCLAAKDNKQIGERLNLNQYLQQPHVVFSDLSGASSNPIDSWLSEQQQQRRAIARTINYMAAARIAAATDAIITLPQAMAELFCQMLPLRMIAAPEELPVAEMQLVTHPLFSNDPALSWLMEQIKSV